jgi:hypothetical protein
MESLRRSPDPVGAVLSWAFGLGLIVLGASWLFIDQSMVILDLVCVAVGFAALPPVTQALRVVKPFSGGAHFATAIGVLAFGFLFTVYGPNPSATLPHRFASNVGALASVASADASPLADAEAQKASYLADLAATSAAAQKLNVDSFAGDRAAVMAGLRTLDGWRALAARAEEFALTSEEQAQVAAFAAVAQKQRTALTPALRRAYAESLGRALSSYGVTAESEGAQADTLHVIGYALNDQSVLGKVRALISQDAQALSYAKVDFVAERTSAAAETAESATSGAAGVPTAVSAAAAPVLPISASASVATQQGPTL